MTANNTDPIVVEKNKKQDHNRDTEQNRNMEQKKDMDESADQTDQKKQTWKNPAFPEQQKPVK